MLRNQGEGDEKAGEAFGTSLRMEMQWRKKRRVRGFRGDALFADSWLTQWMRQKKTDP